MVVLYLFTLIRGRNAGDEQLRSLVAQIENNSKVFIFCLFIATPVLTRDGRAGGRGTAVARGDSRPLHVARRQLLLHLACHRADDPPPVLRDLVSSEGSISQVSGVGGARAGSPRSRRA